MADEDSVLSWCFLMEILGENLTYSISSERSFRIYYLGASPPDLVTTLTHAGKNHYPYTG